MVDLRKGKYHARLAADDDDLLKSQALRALLFRSRAGEDQSLDRDAFDQACEHVLVEEAGGGRLVCSFRLLPLGTGRDIDQSYSAQYYELSALKSFDGPMVEMGRFCIHPDCRDPDILRIAWAAMTSYVDQHRVEMLFGCSSFQGTEGAAYRDAFALLKENHLAPGRWLPRVKAPRVFRFAEILRRRLPDRRRAMLRMPPLLKTYLVMGGWVSDHAVIDTELNTLHVFTGLEISAIPPARARLLRAVAA